MMNMNDILKTKLDVSGIKVIWKDEQIVEVKDGSSVEVKRIYYSYGVNILALEYMHDEDRDRDYDRICDMLELIKK